MAPLLDGAPEIFDRYDRPIAAYGIARTYWPDIERLGLQPQASDVILAGTSVADLDARLGMLMEVASLVPCRSTIPSADNRRASGAWDNAVRVLEDL